MVRIGIINARSATGTQLRSPCAQRVLRLPSLLTHFSSCQTIQRKTPQHRQSHVLCLPHQRSRMGRRILLKTPPPRSMPQTFLTPSGRRNWAGKKARNPRAMATGNVPAAAPIFERDVDLSIYDRYHVIKYRQGPIKARFGNAFLEFLSPFTDQKPITDGAE